jgi:hypothetical protein
VCGMSPSSVDGATWACEVVCGRRSCGCLVGVGYSGSARKGVGVGCSEGVWGGPSVLAGWC